jgi:single-stranded DNA-binding protein
MLDPRNLLNLIGGVVSDPELINDKILKFRLAVDYAGSEKGSDNTSGYFDVVYYLKDNSGFAGKNASFIHGQVTSGKIKKGTKLHLIGRLVQERWRQDDQNRSRTVIVAEHASYVASSGNGAGGKTDSASGSGSSSVPDSF